MTKIKDRNTLAIVSGTIGLSGLMLVDAFSRKANLSKRSYQEAAAGMFLTKRETKKTRGHFLGLIMNGAVSILGAKYIVSDLSKNGRDSLVSKGILAGIAVGAIATVLPNIIPKNSVKPKDASSNLSYVFSNIVYGLLTTVSAAKLGHDSLFDTPPQNNYLNPTEQTSEETRLAD